jgi:glycosyltransferase involved in cell wall biosynthesis
MRLWNDVAVPRVLRKIGANVYLSPDAQGSLRTTIPQLVVIHDINFEHHPDAVPGVYLKYLKSFTPQWVKRATRLATVSAFSKADLVKTYGVAHEKIDVVYNGASELCVPISQEAQQAVRDKLTDGKPFFVCVGSIHPRKNLQRLLPAFDVFKSTTRSDAKLVVVGDVFYMDGELKEAFENLQHKSDVMLVGRLDAEALYETVAASIANVYVSIFEGFGIPILEGFKCGVPVITSNTSSMPEVASDAALIVDPFSVDEIADGLKHIWENPALRNELVAKGKLRAVEFSWDKAANALWESIVKTMNRA